MVEYFIGQGLHTAWHLIRQQRVSIIVRRSSVCCKQIGIIKQSSLSRLPIRPSSYCFSSISSKNDDDTQPKFPMPQYKGIQTQPIPRSILPSSSMPSSHYDGQNKEDQQQYQQELANAVRPSFNSQTPLLLKNILSDCDAIHFWRSLEYWKLAVGEDTPIEVEIGQTYSKESSRVSMMFGEYLNYLTLCKDHDEREFEVHQQQEGNNEQQTHNPTEVAYLAQNELFPQVINDINIPSFCDDDNGRYNVGEGNLYHTMLWMGPRGTVSPLHFDPLDNLLMQVVGWKRVILFPPDDDEDEEESDDEIEKMLKRSRRATTNNDRPTWHYAGIDGNQYNTSAVDIENPNHDKFPNFKALAPTPYETLLGPGDVLYIPKKWWHHVRSCELSVSANVWWR